MVRIAPESPLVKKQLIETLSQKYAYQSWRVRIFDMQRASLRLVNPPKALLPEELRSCFQFATLTLQANGFAFTTSETSPNGHASQQILSPYRVEVQSSASEAYSFRLWYDGQPVDDFQSLRLVEIMGKPSTYYFPYKDRVNGKPLYFYLVLNPYENCAYRCKYCSRLPYFKFKSQDYRQNIQNCIKDVLKQVSSPADVQFISVITGSTASANGDLAMMRNIVDAFDRAGFKHCEYGFYTSNIHHRAELKALRRMRVVFLTVTLETTSDEARHRLHAPNNPKRTLNFGDTMALIRQAEEIFPYVNATLILGYEPAGVLKRNLEILARETKATINHYIPRIWSKRQFELLDPSACNLEYYVDLCAFIEQQINTGKVTIAALFDERFGIPRFQMRYRS
jgi:hypothetical protein